MNKQRIPEDQNGHIIVSLHLNHSHRDWQTEDPNGWLHPLGRLWHLGNGLFWFEPRRADALLCTGWIGTEADLLCLIVLVLGGWLPIMPV